MLFAALVFLCPFPQIRDTVKPTNTQSVAVSVDSAKSSSDTFEVPSTPKANVKREAEPSSHAPNASESSASTSNNSAASVASYPDATPATPVPFLQPGILKPAITHPYETQREKRIWYALAITSSAAATLDAYSTRAVLSRNLGVEANPLMRPFAHSRMLYGAIQASPLFMDFLGRRMMVSRHPLARKFWWAPQAVGATISFNAAAHNLSLLP